MTAVKSGSARRRCPRPRRPFSYEEDLNEAPRVVEAEPVEVETDVPAAERSSIESPGAEPKTPALFEE